MVSIKVGSFSVSSEKYSEMYQKAMQRIKRINSRFETTTITYSFKESVSADEELNTLEVDVYTNVDEKKIKERFCTVCKEFHCNFYINTMYNCDRCEYAAYQERLKEETRAARNIAKKLINS